MVGDLDVLQDDGYEWGLFLEKFLAKLSDGG
jgi:hypothetical protein